MSKTAKAAPAASQRMLRVGELIRHALAEVVARGELHDPALDGVLMTTPQVRMSPDLKLATIFVAPLGGGDADALVAALERNRKAFRAEVARRINLKFAPDLRFKADRGFEAGARIDALLQSPRVQRDLTGGDEADESAAS